MGSNVPVSRAQNTGNIVSSLGGSAIYAVSAVVTLAQLNAGFTLVTGLPNSKLRVTGYYVKVNGAFTGLTAAVISDTTATPVDIATFAQANLTDGAEFNAMTAGTGQTKGAGHMVPLTLSKGIQIRKTGGTAAGGTSLLVLLQYQIV